MEFMTTQEVSEYLGFSEKTIRKYVREFGMPVLQFPGRSKWSFRKDLVDKWYEEHSKPKVVVMTKAPTEKPEGYGKLRVLTP